MTRANGEKDSNRFTKELLFPSDDDSFVKQI